MTAWSFSLTFCITSLPTYSSTYCSSLERFLSYSIFLAYSLSPATCCSNAVYKDMKRPLICLETWKVTIPSCLKITRLSHNFWVEYDLIPFHAEFNHFFSLCLFITGKDNRPSWLYIATLPAESRKLNKALRMPGSLPQNFAKIIPHSDPQSFISLYQAFALPRLIIIIWMWCTNSFPINE